MSIFAELFRSPSLARLKQIHTLTRPLMFALALIMVISLSDRVSAQHYQQTNLVSDIPGLATHTDPNLVNPWGLARSSTSPWWVADNGTGVSTLYNGIGTPSALVVTIPPPPGHPGPSTPTGTVFNGSADFEVAPGQPARFIFVTQDGTISGWNPQANPTNAILKVNNAGVASYFGATLGQVKGANFLFVANFLGGTVDVYDATFTPVSLPAGAFVDNRLPDDYAPFNVQNIEGNIVVTFAKKDEEGEDEVPGPGFGYVDIFDSEGNLLLRLRHGKWMNAPWGVALAPEDFGQRSGRLLIGMFGSGEIASFDLERGNFHGLVRGLSGRPLAIEGLWAIAFGNGGNAGPTNTLFFTAGIEDEEHGLFGTITLADNHDNVMDESSLYRGKE